MQGATTGRLNLHQLRAAATSVIDICAARQQRGGVISGLGESCSFSVKGGTGAYRWLTAGDGNILLTLGRFKPGGESVRCGATQIKVSRCRDILSGMQVVASDERFGLANEEVDVQVPYRISSGKFGSGNGSGVCILIYDGQRMPPARWTSPPQVGAARGTSPHGSASGKRRTLCIINAPA